MIIKYKETNSTVRDYLPLQQGLRPAHQKIPHQTNGAVRDYLPLQQGLRLILYLKTNNQFLCQRLSSTTTRIKTDETIITLASITLSETIFHYNKD